MDNKNSSAPGKEKSAAPTNDSVVVTSQDTPEETSEIVTQNTRTPEIPQDTPEVPSDFRKCIVCGSTFASEAVLNSHINENHLDTSNAVKDLPRQLSTIQCKLCDYSAESAIGLSSHVKKEHIKTSVSCDHCDYTVISSRRLKSHISKEHPGKENSSAPTSDSVVVTSQDTPVNTRTPEIPQDTPKDTSDVGGQYADADADEGIADKDLSRQQSAPRCPNGPKCTQCPPAPKGDCDHGVGFVCAKCAFLCDHCQFSDRSAEGLQRHFNNEHVPRSCPHCSYLAKSQSMLNSHARQHHGMGL